jgi:hypothetical protein
MAKQRKGKRSTSSRVGGQAAPLSQNREDEDDRIHREFRGKARSSDDDDRHESNTRWDEQRGPIPREPSDRR